MEYLSAIEGLLNNVWYGEPNCIYIRTKWSWTRSLPGELGPRMSNGHERVTKQPPERPAPESPWAVHGSLFIGHQLTEASLRSWMQYDTDLLIKAAIAVVAVVAGDGVVAVGGVDDGVDSAIGAVESQSDGDGLGLWFGVEFSLWFAVDFGLWFAVDYGLWFVVDTETDGFDFGLWFLIWWWFCLWFAIDDEADGHTSDDVDSETNGVKSDDYDVIA